MSEEEKIEILKDKFSKYHLEYKDEEMLFEIIDKLQKELDKKDNVINLMAEVIEECRQNDCIEFNEETDLSDIAGEEMVKKYFYKKVERSKNDY